MSALSSLARDLQDLRVEMRHHCHLSESSFHMDSCTLDEVMTACYVYETSSSRVMVQFCTSLDEVRKIGIKVVRALMAASASTKITSRSHHHSYSCSSSV